MYWLNKVIADVTRLPWFQCKTFPLRCNFYWPVILMPEECMFAFHELSYPHNLRLSHQKRAHYVLSLFQNVTFFSRVAFYSLLLGIINFVQLHFYTERNMQLSAFSIERFCVHTCEASNVLLFQCSFYIIACHSCGVTGSKFSVAWRTSFMPQCS